MYMGCPLMGAICSTYYTRELILSIALITVTFDVSTNQVSFTDNKERVFCIGIIILRQTLQTMKQV